MSKKTKQQAAEAVQVQFIEAEALDGGTIRIILHIKGITFKRIHHKSGIYTPVWSDAYGHFGQEDLGKDREKELEAIFKAWCMENNTSETKLLEI